MNDQAKTRKDLLKELHELRKEHDGLKASYKKSIESIRQTEIAFLNGIPLPTFALDERGTILFLNEAFAISFGKTVSELLGKNAFELIPSEISEQRKAIIDKVFKERKSTHFEDSNNNEYFTNYIYPIFDNEGKTINVIVFVIDNTEGKRAEISLKESEEKYRMLLEGSILGVLAFDIETLRCSFSNTSACKLFGYSEEEISRLNLTDFHPKDSIEKVIYEFKSQLCGEKSISEALPCLRKNGTIFYADIAGYSTVINGRNCNIGFIMDVTERKHIEEQLKENAALLLAQLNSTNDGILVIDSNQKRLLINRRMIELFKVPTSIAEDEDDAALLQYVVGLTKYPERFLSKITYLINHHDEISSDVIEFKDGMILDRYSAPVMDKEGKNYGRIWTFRDITDNKQKEKEILELNRDLDVRVKQRTAELEAVNKELETFSYSISHDLKTPLRHITGFISLFLENKSLELTQKDLGYLEVITTSASDMEKLIDGMLNFSKLNTIGLQKKRINSSEMVQQVIAFFDPEIKNRKITFNVESLPEVTGDKELIRQVWTNLISNAIKYTMKKPEAVIEIGSISTNNEITFYIKDNGAGFNMKYAEKLFGVFQRLHKLRDFEGIGIGLANVNRIVTRHCGQCRAEGEVDKGATFYFSLPK